MIHTIAHVTHKKTNNSVTGQANPDTNEVAQFIQSTTHVPISLDNAVRFI